MARLRGDQSGSVKKLRSGWTGRYRVYRDGKSPVTRSIFLGRHSEIPSEDEARRILRRVLTEENDQALATEHLATAKHILRPLGIFGASGKHLPQIRGCVAEMQVTADLLCRGFEVFRPVHPFSSCDLVYVSEGRLVRVEVKSTTLDSDNFPTCDVTRNTGKFDMLASVLPDGSIQYRAHGRFGDLVTLPENAGCLESKCALENS